MDINFVPMDDDFKARLDQFWRCPQCGSQTALGAPAVYSAPPRCHGVEMEQIAAEAFGKFEESS